MSSPGSGTPPDPWSEPPEWFEPFFRGHYQDLLRVALVVGGARHVQEAEDAVQSVMVHQVAVGCWEHIEKPESYFTTAVIRAVLMLHRSRGRRREQSWPEEANTVAGPDRMTVWEDTEWVTRLLKQLPPAQHQVMALTLDGLSGEEVAELLGARESTVRSNLRHARDRLAKLLTEPSDAPCRTRREGDFG